MAQKVEMGILPILRPATDTSAKRGEYYGHPKMDNWRCYPVINEVNPMANKPEITAKLWTVSEGLTSVRF
ncbi:MAG: hypothetical protein GY827_03420 [Cytophagales bacterium]|nr:hypothetical protein [Cytophagales bacterium]